MSTDVLKLFKRIFLIVCFSLPVSAVAETSSEYYEKALESYEEGDFAATFIFLKNSLQQNDDNLPAKILMGKVLMLNNYMQQSEIVLEEALMLGGDPSLIVDTLGKVWLFTKQNEKIIDYEFSNLTKRAQTGWHVIVGSAHSNLEQVALARVEFNKALQISPAYIPALNQLALLELREDNFIESDKYLSKSLILEPNNFGTIRLFGDWKLRQGNIEDAIIEYEKSYALEPSDPFTKRSLVSAYLQIKNLDSARSLLAEILEQTPEDPIILLLQAWILANDQKNTEAVKQLELLSAQLAGLTEESLLKQPMLLYVSALSAYTLQNYQQAVSFFNQYLTLEPENIDAITLLAQSYIKLDDKKRALKLLQPLESEIISKVDTSIILVELYLDANKVYRALEVSQKLLELYPENQNVQLLEVKTLLARGRQQEALNKLDSSGYVDTNIQFTITKAQLLIEMGNLKDADTIADKFLKLYPDNIEFINFKAVIHIRQKKFAQAKTFLDQALAINPKHFTSRLNLATLLSLQGDFDQAIETLVQLDELHPDKVKVMTLLARVQYAKGDLEAASVKLQRVLEIDLENLGAIELLANIYIRQGELKRAVHQFNQAIKANPENAKYQMQRVELYLELKQNDLANGELIKIKQLVHDDPNGLVELSKIQLKADDTQGAKQSIDRAVRLAPKLGIASEYVRIHLITGDFENARNMLTKWLAELPNHPLLLVQSGDVYTANDNPKAAFDVYLKALEIVGNNRTILAKMYKLSNKGISQDVFEGKLVGLLKSDPEDYFSRNLLADFYLNRGDLKGALIQYEKLIEIEQLPNRALILNNMANIYIDVDLIKAEQLINQAIKEGVEVAAIYDTQGWILALTGKYDEALTVLRKAFAMNSDDPSNQYHLAYTLHKLKNVPQAQSTLRRALSSTHSFAERDEAQALLNKM